MQFMAHMFYLIKKQVHLHCDIFRQSGVEMIDQAYIKWFSIETLSE